MKITHNNKSYILNAERAIELGVFKPELPPLPLRAGDVYKTDKGYCNQLLVQVAYDQDKWQLLGMGLHPNSNSFYHTVHTLAEIKAELEKDECYLVKNINGIVGDLVHH